MANGSLVLINLVIIAALERLVAKEMDLSVLHATDVLFTLDMLQAVGLVPSSGKDIERDLATDGESQAVIWELLTKCIDQILSYVVLLVIPEGESILAELKRR